MKLRQNEWNRSVAELLNFVSNDCGWKLPASDCTLAVLAQEQIAEIVLEVLTKPN